jgi:hypothetical protein
VKSIPLDLKVTVLWSVSQLWKDLPPSIQTQLNWLCLGDAFATPVHSSPGQLVPLLVCCERWVNLEWCHRTSGWPEERLLSCVNHCHQKCLSYREQATSWPVRALELSAMAAASSPCVCCTPDCKMWPSLHICLLSGTRQGSWSLYTSMNMLILACAHSEAPACLVQPVLD